ncbi:MAG: hypothetical protein ACI9DC_000103 [Gammaproteobacteria bacterium]|jgi:uncharacterized protein involved in response to NO
MVLTPRNWHVHEMLFGYGLAVLAGFLLTATPNWASRPPIAGTLLKGLVAFWLSGRIALLFLHDLPTLALLITLAFPLSLCMLCWREVAAAGNRRNLPVCALLTVFAGADVIFLSTAIAIAPSGATLSAIALTDHAVLIGWGERAGMACLLLLITLIGGRVVPAFSRNWVKAQSMTRLPAEFGRIDIAALLAGAVALCAFVAMPHEDVTGWLFAAAAALAWVASRSRTADPYLAPGLRMACDRIWPGCDVDPRPRSAFNHSNSCPDRGCHRYHDACDHDARHTGPQRPAIERNQPCIRPCTCRRITAHRRAVDANHDDLSALTLAGVAWSGAFVVFALAYGPMLINVPDKESH